MKIHEIIHENEDEDDDPNRNFPNPMKNIRYNNKMYDIFGDYEDEYLRDYREKNDITSDYSSYFAKARDEVSTIENVPIDKIVPNEEFLYPDALKSLIKGEKIKSSSKHPVFIKYEDEYYIEDGNHRVAAAYDRGETSIKARVVDLDNYLNNR